jgi:hypothetical protein
MSHAGHLLRAGTALPAVGDYGALAAKGRRLLRVDLDGDPVGGLAALEEAAGP